jgi:hypothetical protein
MLCAVFALHLAFQQPPRQSFDKATNQTTYSTGDIRTGGLTGMSVEFKFPGTTPTRPSTVNMGFGALRTHDDNDQKTDEDLLQWKGLTSITIQADGQTLTLSAKPGWRVSKNSAVQIFYGHAVEEFVNVPVSPAQYVGFANAPQLIVQIGTDKRTLKGKTMETLRKLADSIPK